MLHVLESPTNYTNKFTRDFTRMITTASELPEMMPDEEFEQMSDDEEDGRLSGLTSLNSLRDQFVHQFPYERYDRLPMADPR